MLKASTNKCQDDSSEVQGFRTYNSVANLKADQLKKLCLKHGVDIKFPKKARIVLLCNILGISTTGHVQSVNVSTSTQHLNEQQKKQLLALTPAFLCKLTDWKKDLSCIPDLEESSVKKYLVNANVLSSSDAKSYKITRPYALQQFVHSIFYNDNGLSEFCVVRALCNPSQSANPDEVKLVFVIIDKYVGEPFGGFCTCTVGQSERCGHIGGVLFKLAELQATGTTDGPSCTDVLCAWAEPKGCGAEPTMFKDLNIRKNKASIRRTNDDYGKKVVNKSAPTYDDVVELRAKLIEATHHLGQYCPAVHILNCDRFRTESLVPKTNVVTELPQAVEFHNQLLVPAREVEVKTSPITILQLACQIRSSKTEFKNPSQELLTRVHSMGIDISDVDHLTKGQASNPEWHAQRFGSITATKFGAVIKVMEKQKGAETLARDLLGQKQNLLNNVPSIKWGRKNEGKAKQMYTKIQENKHKDFKLQEHGVVVYKDCNFIRGSPDGTVSCSCHEARLLEIKCPFSARLLTVTEAVQCGKIKYLERINGQFHLKQNSSDGYYAQVQGLMGITNTKTCHFVVWTTRDLAIVKVTFDETFFSSKIVPSCKQFFEVFVIPKLLKYESGISSTCQPQPADEKCGTVPEKPLVPTPLETALDQPSKRRRDLSTPCKTKSISPKLIVPSSSVTACKPNTSAQMILSELVHYKCSACKKVLPEDNIAQDNSDASVGCDCPNCGGCDIWMCWPCARYDQEWADSGTDWYCPDCTRECDIVY